jgi:hypothetical protein
MPRGLTKTVLPAAPGGVIERVNPATIPDGKLLASKNWITREGTGRPRPGYELIGSQLTAADPVLGFGFRGTLATESNMVVHTASAAYSWNGSAFSAITGTWTSSNANNHVRFTVFQQSGTFILIRTNLQNAPDKWTGSGSFVDLGGTPPVARDLTTTNGRVVLFYANNEPRRVQWSGFNTAETWGAADFSDLTDTPDEIVGGRAFGPLSMAIYKQDSVWLGQAQVAAAPFQFQLIGFTPGPVSPAAIVPWREAHYYFAKDLSVYRFDGGRVLPVGVDLPKHLQQTLDWPNRDRIFGFVLPLPEPELWFVYPQESDGAMKRGISINLATNAMSPHQFAHEITAGSEWIARPVLTIDGLDTISATIDGLDAFYPTIDSMGTRASVTSVIGESTGRVDRFGRSVDDRGTAIDWEFTHPWRPAGELGNRCYLDGIASYWKKTPASLTVTVGVTITDSLGDADTESTATFNTSTDSNHLSTFPNKTGQWVKVRHAASSQIAGLEHRGAAILAWPRAMV